MDEEGQRQVQQPLSIGAEQTDHRRAGVMNAGLLVERQVTDGRAIVKDREIFSGFMKCLVNLLELLELRGGYRLLPLQFTKQLVFGVRPWRPFGRKSSACLL